MISIFYILSVASIGVMAYALYRVLVLRRRIPGGVVKSTWNVMTGLVVLFMVGYLATPFFSLLPALVKELLVGVIFFFGAIFVVIVVNLFFRVVKEIGL